GTSWTLPDRYCPVFELLCSVEKISEQFMIPVLEALLEKFPFKIVNFHSDNSSDALDRCPHSL
ncbi:MAG: hypothetical protein ACI9Z9_000918, partial [Litorivivens sp.]